MEVNEGIAVTCLVSVAGALWRVLVWLARRADRYLDHRLKCDVELVEHLGAIARAIQERLPEGAIAEIHAAIVKAKAVGP